MKFRVWSKNWIEKIDFSVCRQLQLKVKAKSQNKIFDYGLVNWDSIFFIRGIVEIESVIEIDFGVELVEVIKARSCDWKWILNGSIFKKKCQNRYLWIETWNQMVEWLKWLNLVIKGQDRIWVRNFRVTNLMVEERKFDNDWYYESKVIWVWVEWLDIVWCQKFWLWRVELIL